MIKVGISLRVSWFSYLFDSVVELEVEFTLNSVFLRSHTLTFFFFFFLSFILTAQLVSVMTIPDGTS